MGNTNEQIAVSDLYSKLYSSVNAKGGLYGGVPHRDSIFIKYLKDTPPCSVIDFSCGRGFLLRYLKARGFSIRGTEIADSLLEKGGELYGMPVDKMFYSELGSIPDNSYDIVISNDVIEHLPDEHSVDDAIKNLVRISKKTILLSTGGMKAATAMVPGTGNLHLVVRPKRWWVDIANKYYKVTPFEAVGTLFLFGDK